MFWPCELDIQEYYVLGNFKYRTNMFKRKKKFYG